ncbi:uncharacterized protein LOC124079199 isoform X1 [Marmota monax]|uniref:uncharacterized protein LOC124079199 isoform X1 n=1 Tax=Marmota monax TaxID=9995 RepID=UPI0026F0B389|nr:uncharacterized protein LOC124079199 isoform X1 [Marmota monax]
MSAASLGHTLCRDVQPHLEPRGMEPAFHGLRPPSPWSPVCFARTTGGVLNQPCPVDAGGKTEDKRGRRSQGNSKAQSQATPFPLRPETEGPCAVGSAAPGPWESKARIRIYVTNDPGSLETLGWGDCFLRPAGMSGQPPGTHLHGRRPSVTEPSAAAATTCTPSCLLPVAAGPRSGVCLYIYEPQNCCSWHALY